MRTNYPAGTLYPTTLGRGCSAKSGIDGAHVGPESACASEFADIDNRLNIDTAPLMRS